MIRGPCKDCQERTPECHAKCERYAAYREKKAVEAKKRMESAIMDGYDLDRHRRMSRDGGWNMKRDKK